MSDPIFKMNGNEVEYPVNMQELQYNIQFDKDETDVSISINEWEFAHEHKQILDDWRREYFFEGLPIQVDVGGTGNAADILEFLLSVKDANPISCNGETIPAIEAIDALQRNREFTIEYVIEGAKFGYRVDAGDGKSKALFVDVPYCKNAPQDVEVFLALLSAAFLIIEVENLVSELIDKIANASSYEWGEWIASIPFFIKGVTVSLASIQILQNIYQLLVQPVKYHKGMYLRDVLEIGYAFLGYKFQSSIFDTDPFDKVVLLPKKRQNPFNDDINQNILLDLIGLDLSVLKGFTEPNDNIQTGYYDETFDFLIRGLKDSMNLKEVIESPVDGSAPVIRLERRDYKKSQDRVTLPPLEIDEWTFNADEFNSMYTVLWSVDSTDINTLENYYGTSFTEHTYPSQADNQRNLLLGGFRKVQIPFARGIRKTQLNKSEVILDKLFSAAQPVIEQFVFQHNVKLRQAVTIATTFIDIFNDITEAVNSLPGFNVTRPTIQTPSSLQNVPELVVPNYSALISDRIGMLLLENDHFEVDKLILVDPQLIKKTVTIDTTDHWLADTVFGLFGADEVADFEGLEAPVGSPRSNKLDTRNATILDAEYFWNKFHSIESFVPNIDGVVDWSNGKHNQYKKYDAQRFNLCIEDFRKLKTSNFVSWCEQDGEFFSDLSYSPFEAVAEGKFKINEIYYDKLISRKIKVNGSTRRT